MGFFQNHCIRIVEFNVENLFILLDHYSGQDLSKITEKEWQKLSASLTPNKPIQQVLDLAKSIREIQPDILMLCEVGGRESLINFNRYFLNDEYIPHLIEGNSDRGIDIGYLTRKSLPFTYDLISHKHRSIDFLYPHEKQLHETGYKDVPSAKITSHKFSRDVLELRVFEDKDKPPVLISLLVHLKSQLDPNRVDPGGRDRRKAELEKLIKIHSEIDSEFQGETPIILGGDFNGVAALPGPEPEFEAIYRDTNLKDCLEVAAVSREERFTYMQLYQNRVGINRQLDYIFIPPELFDRVSRAETWVFRFTDEFGMTMILPKNLTEKKLLPADHYPVVLTLKPQTS